MSLKPTVYIIEDDPLVRESIADLVKTLDTNIEAFSRARDFLEKFRLEGPACLVLEMRMPDMSGLELQARLAQTREQVPILFLTGYADIRVTVAAIKAGAVNLLEKPFEPRELREEIQKALSIDTQTWQERKEARSIEQQLALLKAKEREVFERMAAGKTNVEIALELNLSIRGVEARRAMVLKKLRIDSKVELKQLLRRATALFPPQKTPGPNAPP